MRLRSALILVFVLLAPALPAATQSGAPTVVLLPFEDFSGSEGAQAAVERQFLSQVTARGWTVVPSTQADAILQGERVRYLDSLDDPVRARILNATGASAILVGSIYRCTEGRNPAIALSATMMNATGAVLWADVVSLTADDTERLFGFSRQKTIQEIVETAVRQLIVHFPAQDARVSLAGGPERPMFKESPLAFVAPDLDRSAPIRVCILPFENRSDDPEATKVVSDLLAIRLRASGEFDVIDPAVLRAAALSSKIGSLRWLSADGMKRLGESVGTPLFIRGTIYSYVDTSGTAGEEPRLDVELTLVDSRQDRVLWAAQHDRIGSDYVGFLMRGSVTTAVRLTDRVLTEIVTTAVEGPGQKEGRSATERAAQRRVPERHSRLKGTTDERD